MFVIYALVEHLNWQRGREDGVWMTLNIPNGDLERIKKQLKEDEEEEK